MLPRLYVLMKLAADSEQEVTISQLLLLDDIDSIKGASSKLRWMLPNQKFLVPSDVNLLVKVVLPDSHYGFKTFL